MDTVERRTATVGEVMTRYVHTATRRTPARELSRILFDNQIGAVPVLDEMGRPVGTVVATELLRALAGGAQSGGDLAAEDVMHQPIVTVAWSASLFEAARLMQSAGAGHLVAVDDRGRLCGIVSKGDLLRALVLGWPGGGLDSRGAGSPHPGCSAASGSGRSRRRGRWRASWSLDITVPMGTSRISAMAR